MTAPKFPDLNAPLDSLRSQVIDLAPLGTEPLAPGLFFHRDPEAEMKADWSSPADRLLHLETQVARPGRWLALHLSLPALDLAGSGVLGFALRGTSARPTVLTACLRSGREGGGFQDCFFEKRILSDGNEVDHLAMIRPGTHPELPMQAPWREFVLFLPPDHGIQWTLTDLRLFAA